MNKKLNYSVVGDMTELENKFIIMSRISVSLHRKGVIANVNLFPEFCSLAIQTSGGGYDVIKTVSSSAHSESDLLKWWDAIENSSIKQSMKRL